MDNLFVREQDLLALLDQIDDAAKSGRGAVHLIVAEAGAGKSRLLHELGVRIKRDKPDMVFLLGQARATQASINSFHPFRRAVESLAELPVKQRGNLKHAFKALWQRAPQLLSEVPWVGPLVLTAQTIHDGMAGSASELAGQLDVTLLDFFHDLAADKVVVLALDDMHWVDASSASLLIEVAERQKGKPLVILVSYRPKDIEASQEAHPLEDALTKLSRSRRIKGILKLDPLTEFDLTRLVTDVTRVRPSPRLLRWLAQTCAGNPFFVEEYVALLNDRKSLRVVGDEIDWASDDIAYSYIDRPGLPYNIGEVLNERLLLIGKNSSKYDVLQAACVLNGDFDGETIAQIGDLEVANTRRALSAICQRSGLVRSTPHGYTFWHGLVRVYLEQQLKFRDSSRYRQLHKRAADTLDLKSREPEMLGVIARHLHEAQLHDRAASACLDAAQAVAQLGGLQEANHFAEWAWYHAIQVRDPVRQVAAGLERGRLLMDLRRVHAAKAVLEETTSLDRQHGNKNVAELCLQLAKAHRMENDWASARDRLREADAVVSSDDHLLRARIGLLTGEIALCGSPQDLNLARAVLCKASTLAQKDAEMSACIWGHLALTELAESRVEDAETLLLRAYNAAQASGNPSTRFVVALFTTHVALALMDLPRAGKSLAIMRELADVNLIARTDVDRYQGRLDCLRGDFYQASSGYCRFLVSDLTLGQIVPEAHSWVLSHITLQVDEIRSIAGRENAWNFMNALRRVIRGNETIFAGRASDILDLLRMLSLALSAPVRLHEVVAVQKWHQEHGGWNPSARAAYDFYGNDLVNFRASLQS